MKKTIPLPARILLFIVWPVIAVLILAMVAIIVAVAWPIILLKETWLDDKGAEQ